MDNVNYYSDQRYAFQQQQSYWNGAYESQGHEPYRSGVEAVPQFSNEILPDYNDNEPEPDYGYEDETPQEQLSQQIPGVTNHGFQQPKMHMAPNLGYPEDQNPNFMRNDARLQGGNYDQYGFNNINLGVQPINQQHLLEGQTDHHNEKNPFHSMPSTYEIPQGTRYDHPNNGISNVHHEADMPTNQNVVNQGVPTMKQKKKDKDKISPKDKKSSRKKNSSQPLDDPVIPATPGVSSTVQHQRGAHNMELNPKNLHQDASRQDSAAAGMILETGPEWMATSSKSQKKSKKASSKSPEEPHHPAVAVIDIDESKAKGSKKNGKNAKTVAEEEVDKKKKSSNGCSTFCKCCCKCCKCGFKCCRVCTKCALCAACGGRCCSITIPIIVLLNLAWIVGVVLYKVL